MSRVAGRTKYLRFDSFPSIEVLEQAEQRGLTLISWVMDRQASRMYGQKPVTSIHLELRLTDELAGEQAAFRQTQELYDKEYNQPAQDERQAEQDDEGAEAEEDEYSEEEGNVGGEDMGEEAP